MEADRSEAKVSMDSYDYHLDIAGTGHRPPRLGLGYDQKSVELLTRFAREHLEGMVKASPRFKFNSVVSGMAQGWDQALGLAALELDIPLICALPFEGQEAKWPLDARGRYQKMLADAREVVVVCEGGYAAAKFIERDHWMVDNSNMLLALWDLEETGGTWATVKYARDEKVAVGYLWYSWLEFQNKYACR